MVKSKKMLQALKMDAPRLNDRMNSAGRGGKAPREYEFNVGPETGQKLHLVFLHTTIVV